MCWSNAHKQDREKERRIAWVKGQKICSKATGSPISAVSGAIAAAVTAMATAATAARKKGAAAATKAAALPKAGVGTYNIVRLQWQCFQQQQLFEQQQKQQQQQRGARTLQPRWMWLL
jgi:hypothetical protein